MKYRYSLGDQNRNESANDIQTKYSKMDKLDYIFALYFFQKS